MTAPIVTIFPIALPVEITESVLIGEVSVTSIDPVTLTQTGGLGTVSLGPILPGGLQEILYTAPGIATAATDTFSYTVTDKLHDLSTTIAATTVTLDPGLTETDAPPVVLESGQSTAVATFTPGLPGDTFTLLEADPGLSLGPVAANGTEQVIYTAPAGVTTSATETLSYAVVDENGIGNVYTATVQLDGGPVVTQSASIGSVENNQSIVIGTVAAGVAGDTLTLTQGTGSLGTVSLGAVVNGVQQILYTAPAHILAMASDSVSYSITDQHNDATAIGSASVQLDTGVSITTEGQVTLAQGQSAVVDIVTAGLPGDVVTLTQTVAGLGVFSLQQIGGSATVPNSYDVIYTETGAYTTSQRDTAAFTVVDRAGGKTAGDTPYVRLEAGAKISSSQASVKAGPGQTVTIGIVTPGLAGDTLSISAGPGVAGSFSLGPVTTSGAQKILYTAPGSVATNGTVMAISYTISNQTGENAVSGGSSVILSNPLPTITKQTATVVEKGQSTLIGTVNPGTSGDTLTLAQTSGTNGTVSLVLAGGIEDIEYTAASSIASSATANVGYTVTDEHGGTVSGTASVLLDAGPKLSSATAGVVVQGQSTVIGIVSPGRAGDVETLTQTGTSQGTVTLSGNKVIYTAAANVSSTGIDAVSYTVTDQHSDATVSGSASVKVLGAAPTTTSATITSTTAGNFIDLTGGSPAMTFTGANSVLLLGGSANPAITDNARGLTIDIGSDSAAAIIKNFAADSSGVIDLLYGIGGYTSAAAVQAALTSDGSGGSILPFGAGSIDFVNQAPGSIAASHFKIG